MTYERHPCCSPCWSHPVSSKTIFPLEMKPSVFVWWNSSREWFILEFSNWDREMWLHDDWWQLFRLFGFTHCTCEACAPRFAITDRWFLFRSLPYFFAVDSSFLVAAKVFHRHLWVQTEPCLGLCLNCGVAFPPSFLNSI